MSRPTRFFFDFADPLSYVVEVALRELEAAGAARVERVGYELQPPPAPLTRSSDRVWSERLQAARRAAPALTLDPPTLVPWTRKALELHVFAGARGVGAPVRRAVFEAHFGLGRDIGRIDELVAIAAAAGLDRSEAKAALDVDAHQDDVLDARRSAEGLGVGEVPALFVEGALAQGFHNLTDLSTLLGGLPGGGR